MSQKNIPNKDNDPDDHYVCPETPAPYTSAILTGIFGRYGRGFLLWGLVGAILAAALWIVYALVCEW